MVDGGPATKISSAEPMGGSESLPAHKSPFGMTSDFSEPRINGPPRFPVCGLLCRTWYNVP